MVRLLLAVRGSTIYPYRFRGSLPAQRAARACAFDLAVQHPLHYRALGNESVARSGRSLPCMRQKTSPVERMRKFLVATLEGRIGHHQMINGQFCVV